MPQAASLSVVQPSSLGYHSAFLSWADSAGSPHLFYPDLVISEEWSESATATQHPVEQGANVIDHVRVELVKCSLTIFATNEPIGPNNWDTPSTSNVTLTGLSSPAAGTAGQGPVTAAVWNNELALKGSLLAAGGVVGGRRWWRRWQRGGRGGGGRPGLAREGARGRHARRHHRGPSSGSDGAGTGAGAAVPEPAGLRRAHREPVCHPEEHGAGDLPQRVEANGRVDDHRGVLVYARTGHGLGGDHRARSHRGSFRPDAGDDGAAPRLPRRDDTDEGRHAKPERCDAAAAAVGADVSRRRRQVALGAAIRGGS